VSAAPGGAEIVVEQTDRYRGLAFMVFRYFALRRELNALETWAQTGKADNSGLFERPETQVLLAILSTLLLWPFLGLNQKGLILSSMLTVVIAFHELGHLAAYRSFGHKSVRMIFIPFLGGIAIGGRPYRTLFEVAVCALMGAGLSAFLVPVVIAVHAGLTPAHPGIANGPMMIFLLILSSFNLLNLLPMYRFDGGQVLRQVFPTRDGLMGATFAVTSAILWAGWRIGIPDEALFGGLAVMALISFTGQSGAKPREALDDMSGGERLVAGFGYYSALVIHVYGLIFAAGILYP
jgi:Zn-dependent protease